MSRTRPSAAALMTGALMLPLGAIAPSASAAPGDASPPEPQSTAQLCASVPESYDPFTDISGNTHERAIECAAYAGIARGGPGSLPEDRYGPAMDVRRDQMASFIARMMDTAEQLDTGDNIRPLPAYDGTPAFSDVSQSSVHFEAVHRLEQAGIVQGGPGGRPSDQYGPELPTQRDQMASFLNRAVEFMTGSFYSSADDYFTDDEASVHEDNINGVASVGIAVGDGQNLYNPSITVPRDQMASFLMRTLAVLHESGQIRDVEQAGTQTGQTFIVAPQQPRETAAGEPLEFSIAGRYDDQEFAGPVDLTLFPCPNVEATSSPVRFTDADGDGLADGIASTEQSQAYISEVEGVETGGRELYLEDQGPGSDGVLEFTTIAGPGADCAIVVAFDDQNDDRQLSVDAEGRPTEPFGVGKGTWTGGEQAVQIAAVDADGRAVVLDGQTGEVLRVLLEGINVDDPADNAIAVTPNRNTVYVVRPGASGTQDAQIVRVPMAGGQAEDVTQGNSPALRPDGEELAYVRFVDTGEALPERTIRLRNLTTGAERAITVGQQDFYGIWDLSWTDDGTRIAFTAGEISTAVHIVDRTASTLDEGERLGPENNEATWDDVASLGGDQLAVIERCCGQPNADPQTWHVVTVDATTGSVDAEIFGQDRTEAVEIDDRDDGTGLLAVEGRGAQGGGTLLRWNGSDSSVRTLTEGIIVAAW